jgi:GNAT superfamily N-acetyltransferase
MDIQPAASLVDAMREEIAVMYDGLDLDADAMPKAGPGELGPPGGVYLVGFDEAGTAICGGGLKRLDDEACEIKRMFVIPEARNRGHARELLVALEDAARDRGYSVIRLDTGPKQKHSERLYRDTGYTEIENFNANPMASFFGEKHLER